LGGLFVYPTGTLRSTDRALRWDSEAKRKGSAEKKVGRMVAESNITTSYRCYSQESKNHLCEAFVPPRPRDRHRLKKGDSRAGYWCRRTAFLAKEVAVATREAREAKEMIQMAQEAHEKQFRKAHEAHEQQFQQVQEQMEEMKQLIATSLKQSVQQFSVAQEQAADTQELLAPLVQQSPPAQATDAQRVQAASQLLQAIPGCRDQRMQFSVAQEQVADTQELLAPPEQVADTQEPLAPLAPWELQQGSPAWTSWWIQKDRSRDGQHGPIAEVLDHFSIQELCAVRIVSKAWRKLMLDTWVAEDWRTFFLCYYYTGADYDSFWPTDLSVSGGSWLATRRLQAAIRGRRDRRVVQASVAQEQVADTQEFLAPLVQQSPPAQATDAQRVQAASRLQAVIRGRYQLVTAYLWDGYDWQFWQCYARRLRADTSRFDQHYRHHYYYFTSTPQKFQWCWRRDYGFPYGWQEIGER